MQGSTFSSAHARERDKRIEDKHQKELYASARKLENVKRSNDELRKELFDFKNRTTRLVECLGYSDISELQEALDMMSPDFNFKNSIEHVHELETEVQETRSQAESYAAQLEDVTDCLKECQIKLSDQENKYAALARENDDLKGRYAGLNNKYNRAAELYKRDFAKWRNVYRFLEGEAENYRKLRNAKGTTAEEKQRLENLYCRRRAGLICKTGPDLELYDEPPPPIGGIELPEDLRTPNLATTVAHPMVDWTPAAGSRPSQFASSSRTLVAPKHQYDSPTKIKHEASSDTEPSSPMRPLPAPFKLPGVPLSKTKQTLESASSDTEPESHPFTPPRRAPAFSSDTEPESHPFTPPHRVDDEDDVLTPSTSANVTERPSKIRRLNSITPRKSNENLRPQTEPKPDYSVFKGKGRYSRKSDAGPSTSVNARFMIDPEKNGGLDYQYDEVVRGRDARKKMNAGTCQECDDYYEAVGPLPARLQAPLWRSPTKTPKKMKRKACTHHNAAPVASSSRRQSDIEGHKKDISRHRYTWDRPKTPPAYWNIGFPSTQEAKEINAKAERMHQEKVEGLEREVASGTGKYRRR